MGAAQESNVVTLSRFRVKEAQIQRFEFDNTVWSVSVDANTPYEEILKPEYWAHVVLPKNMKIGDEIKAKSVTGEWFAWLMIRDCGNTWAKVEVLFKKDFEAAKPEADGVSIPGFKVEWQGIANKFVVIREKDGAVISQGHKRKSDAQIALIEHNRSIGA